jgi:hypothetical protein
MDLTSALMAHAATISDIDLTADRPLPTRRPTKSKSTPTRRYSKSKTPVNGRVYKVTVGEHTRFILSAFEPDTIAKRALRTPEAFGRDLRVSGLSEKGDPYTLRFLSVDPSLTDDEGVLPEIIPPCPRCGHDAEDHHKGVCISWACICV